MFTFPESKVHDVHLQRSAMSKPQSINPAGAVLVTGATSGLGLATVRRLAAAGRPVVIGGRRRDAVAALVEEMNSASPGIASGFVADLADLSDLRRALDTSTLPPLHGIMTNAGLSSDKTQRSAQGYELTFAVNVLAHQFLLMRLAPVVLEGGRIIVVSSGVHDPDNKLARRAGVPAPKWTGTTHLARPDSAPPEAVLHDGRLRYSTSKLGNVLQARGFQQQVRAAERDVDVFALDPGLMVDTDFAREYPSPVRFALRGVGRLLTPLVANMRLSSTTAAIACSLFNDEKWNGTGFSYLDGDNRRRPSPDAQRDDLVKELMTESVDLIKADSAST